MHSFAHSRHKCHVTALLGLATRLQFVVRLGKGAAVVRRGYALAYRTK